MAKVKITKTKKAAPKASKTTVTRTRSRVAENPNAQKAFELIEKGTPKKEVAEKFGVSTNSVEGWWATLKWPNKIKHNGGDDLAKKALKLRKEGAPWFHIAKQAGVSRPELRELLNGNDPLKAAREKERAATKEVKKAAKPASKSSNAKARSTKLKANEAKKASSNPS